MQFTQCIVIVTLLVIIQFDIAFNLVFEKVNFSVLVCEIISCINYVWAFTNIIQLSS